MEGTIGEIRMFAGNYAPRNWAFCDGTLLSVASYQDVFSVIGAIYGGNGTTTFGLPDLRGRVAVHAGTGPGPGLNTRRLGEMGGGESNYLTVAQLPPHNHMATGTVRAVGAPGNERIPNGNSLAGSGTDSQYSNSTASVLMAEGNVGVIVENTGAGQSVNNMQPFGAVNYIICLSGLYPSRS